jgi:sRNA-binding protein
MQNPNPNPLEGTHAARRPQSQPGSRRYRSLGRSVPGLLSVFQQRRKPLKLGIHNDIMAALNGAITPKECATAMRVYCGNGGYLRACKVGAQRIDLNGEVAGHVTVEEAEGSRGTVS